MPAAIFQGLHHLLVRAHQLLSGPGHEHSVLPGLPDGHFGGLRLVEQVADLFPVDLEELDVYLIGAVGLLLLLPPDLIEQVGYDSRDDAFILR